MKPVERLLNAVRGHDNLLIVPHYNPDPDPDPDAIAGAVGLQFLLAQTLGVKSQIGYAGIIGRAENKAMVKYLNAPLTPLAQLPESNRGPLALVDTQPGAGNTPNLGQLPTLVVVDHHDRLDFNLTQPNAAIDIRPNAGATSSILTEYLQAAGLNLAGMLATALFYGIKTNTIGLGRNVSGADTAAYHFLQPQIEVEVLTQIEQARVSPDYFKSFDTALRAARIYNGLVISYIGPMEYPELAAEMADLLLRLEESQWVVCLGQFGDNLILSVRARRRQPGSQNLAQAIVGGDGTAGGHGVIAGGQIPLEGRNPNRLAPQLVGRIRRYLNIPANLIGRRLI